MSDNGTSFVSNIMEELLKIFKIKHKLCSPYTPASNGIVERSHACIGDFIRSYAKSYNDWDRLCDFAAFSFNTTVHSATGFSPFELNHGRIARFPVKIPNYDKLLTYNVFLRDLILRLNEINRWAAERQNTSKQKSKERYDACVKPMNLTPGGYAYVKKELRTHKFDKYYDAPLKVIEVTNSNNVILELPNKTRIVKHLNKVKPAYHNPTNDNPISK